MDKLDKLNMLKYGGIALVAAALIVGSVDKASASIMANGTDANGTVLGTINFNGIINNVVVPGLTAKVDFTFGGIVEDYDFGGGDVFDTYKLNFTMMNTSDPTVFSSTRISRWAFNVDPNEDAGAIGGSTVFTRLLFDVNFNAGGGGGLSVEVCVATASGAGANCGGGGGKGLLTGQSTSGMIWLGYDSLDVSANEIVPEAVVLSDFMDRYQSITSVDTCDSSQMTCFNEASAIGDGTNKVPEPGTLGVLGIGLAGLGWAVRRRRKAA